MITVRPVEYAPGVELIVKRPGNGSRWLNVSRRVARTATLDGGAAIYDGGFADADRTLVVVVDSASREVVQTMQSFCKLYPRVNATTVEGVFEAAPRDVEIGDGNATLTLFVARKR